MTKTLKYYLYKGCDKKRAEYFLKGKRIFTHIQQIEIFRRVYLDNFGCPAWDINPNINGKNILENKIDISADRCYIEGIPVKDI